VPRQPRFVDRQNPNRNRLATPAAVAESIAFAEDLVVALGLGSAA
jgi:hypothetical protein